MHAWFRSESKPGAAAYLEHRWQADVHLLVFFRSAYQSQRRFALSIWRPTRGSLAERSQNGDRHSHQPRCEGDERSRHISHTQSFLISVLEKHDAELSLSNSAFGQLTPRNRTRRSDYG